MAFPYKMLVACAACRAISSSSVDRVIFAVSDEGSLSLLQQQSHVDGAAQSVGALQGTVAAARIENESSIARQRNEYATNLTALQFENRKQEIDNSQLARHISQIEKANVNLEATAERLRQHTLALVASLENLEANFTRAQSTAKATLNHSQELLDSAPALKVLQDFAEESEGENEQPGKKVVMSALQMDPQVLPNHDDMLKEVTASLVQVGASPQEVQARFAEEFSKGVAFRERLLAEERELSSSHAYGVEMHFRLKNAVEHLTQVNDYLHERADSLRSTSGASSGTPVHESSAGAVSLLQTESRQQSLRDINKVLQQLQQPSPALNFVNGHVKELQERVAELTQRSISELHAQRKEYDQKLMAVEANISEQATQNARLQDTIAEVDNSIGSFRLTADLLVADNAKLRADLKSIEENVTIVQEFLHEVLESTDEPVPNTTDLAILHELAEQDKVSKAERAHRVELDEVSKVALLQVHNQAKALHDAAAGGGAPAQDILSSLQTSFQVLMDAHNASKERLREEFEEEHQRKRERYKDLLDQWEDMNATLADKQQVLQKVKVAVNHLTKTRDMLKKKRESLLTFVERLAARPRLVENFVLPVTGRSGVLPETDYRGKKPIDSSKSLDGHPKSIWDRAMDFFNRKQTREEIASAGSPLSNDSPLEWINTHLLW